MATISAFLRSRDSLQVSSPDITDAGETGGASLGDVQILLLTPTVGEVTILEVDGDCTSISYENYTILVALAQSGVNSTQGNVEDDLGVCGYMSGTGHGHVGASSGLGGQSGGSVTPELPQLLLVVAAPRVTNAPLGGIALLPLKPSEPLDGKLEVSLASVDADEFNAHLPASAISRTPVIPVVPMLLGTGPPLETINVIGEPGLLATLGRPEGIPITPAFILAATIASGDKVPAAEFIPVALLTVITVEVGETNDVHLQVDVDEGLPTTSSDLDLDGGLDEPLKPTGDGDVFNDLDAQ